MRIQSGLFDHMVLQRDRRGISRAQILGTCGPDGQVVASVRKNGRAVKGLAAVVLGETRRGKFDVVLAGVPAGGPYEIELRVEASGTGETVRVKDVLVGDVWLLGGQSNMQGVGLLSEAPKPDPQVRAFTMDDRWGVAREPLHLPGMAIDPVHGGVPGGKKPKGMTVGTGPGLAFALNMLERTGVPQGVIACAHGGTTMAQWDPKKKTLGGRSLYGAMIRRLLKNGGAVAGMVWYQGESDSHPEGVQVYTRAMKDLVKALRRDTKERKLPVVIVQLARHVGRPVSGHPDWNRIQDLQRLLPERIDNLLTVPAVDLPLDDGIHIGGRGQVRLGARLAEAMDVLRRGRKAGRPPIGVEKIEIVDTVRGTAEVHVVFANVRGKLRAGGRPFGFVVHDELGTAHSFDTVLKGRRAIVRTALPSLELHEKFVSYGVGADPCCNVVDEGDRSLPVFGPLPVTKRKPRALTVFAQAFRIGRFDKSVASLKAPPRPKKMERRVFDDRFANCHDWFRAMTAGGLLYEAVFNCAETMKVAICLGYDGPVKAWLDGKQVFQNRKGVNPAIPDEGRSKSVGLGKGRHVVRIALDGNGGLAWGIFLRLERTDVNARQLAGDRPCPVPVWRD